MEGAERVRKSPGIFLGSNDIEGCKHAFFEILSNSIDEAKSGHGDIIEVTKYSDGRIGVKDYGRGVPLGWNENVGRYNYDLVYCELFAGGKLSSRENYDGRNLGVFGIGACVTQCSSEFFDVYSYYQGKERHVHFEKGIPSEEGLKVRNLPKEEKERTGTVQIWKPDSSVFLETDIPAEHFKEVLKYQAAINGGIFFSFYDEKKDEKETFYYEKGILEYIEEISEGEGVLGSPAFFSSSGKGKDREDLREYEVQLHLGFCFHERKNHILYFHNSSLLNNEGSHDKGLKSGITNALDKILKEKKLYNKSEQKVSFADIEPNLILLSSSFSDSDLVSYENQTKKSIKNKFIREFLSKSIEEYLEKWLIENPLDASAILSQILINKRSKEAAEKQRLAAKKQLKKSVDVTTRSEKLSDCREQDPAASEIFFTEGDSAAGAASLGRDSYFQAVMPVKGKVLNCQKSTIPEAIANPVFSEILSVLGIRAKYNKKEKKLEVDISRLRYHKIIILTDADIDGLHIRTLLLIMFYRICPQLIKEGKVYICQSPLFEMTYKKQTYFAFSDAEKDRFLKGKDPSKVKIQRSKGLGENDPEMMWESTLNPSTRRLTQISLSDEKEAFYMADMLLGNNIKGRKSYIKENGHLYIQGEETDF